MLREMAEALEVADRRRPRSSWCSRISTGATIRRSISSAMLGAPPGTGAPARRRELSPGGRHRRRTSAARAHAGAAGAPPVRGFALAFLREADVAAYLAQRFGGHAFPPELARAVHRRTDGNPLFMVRVVDELVTLGVLADRGRALAAGRAARRNRPRGSREPPPADREADRRLEPEAQRLLEVASVLGSEFTVPSVAAGLDEDPLAVEERCDALARQGQLLAAIGAVRPARRDAGRPLPLHPQPVSQRP